MVKTETLHKKGTTILRCFGYHDQDSLFLNFDLSHANTATVLNPLCSPVDSTI